MITTAVNKATQLSRNAASSMPTRAARTPRRTAVLGSGRTVHVPIYRPIDANMTSSYYRRPVRWAPQL